MKSKLALLFAVSLLCAGCSSVENYNPPSGIRSATPEKTFGGSLSGNVITDSEWTAVVNETLNSIVKVEVETCSGLGSGSGFRVGQWIVTNKHVVEDATKVDVLTLDKKYLRIKSWYIAANEDLALLRLPTSDLLPLSFENQDAIPGDLVALVGYPLGGDQDVRRGRIFEILDDMEGDSETFVFSVTADALPGDSGGPAINSFGKVVGVTYAIDLRESKSLVLPVSRVKNLLESVPKIKEPPLCRD